MPYREPPFTCPSCQKVDPAAKGRIDISPNKSGSKVLELCMDCCHALNDERWNWAVWRMRQLPLNEKLKLLFGEEQP